MRASLQLSYDRRKSFTHATLGFNIEDHNSSVCTNSYAVDIPAAVGDTEAFIGFTGGTGSAHADMMVENFSIGAIPTAPAPFTIILAAFGLVGLELRRRRHGRI